MSGRDPALKDILERGQCKETRVWDGSRCLRGIGHDGFCRFDRSGAGVVRFAEWFGITSPAGATPCSCSALADPAKEW